MEILKALTEHIDFASMVLLLFLLVMYRGIKYVERDPEFKGFYAAFNDEDGKPSWMRALMPPCFVIYAWFVMAVTLHALSVAKTPEAMDIVIRALCWVIIPFGIIFVLPKTVDKLLDVWGARGKP